jgi:hypothetical protein
LWWRISAAVNLDGFSRDSGARAIGDGGIFGCGRLFTEAPQSLTFPPRSVAIVTRLAPTPRKATLASPTANVQLD